MLWQKNMSWQSVQMHTSYAMVGVSVAAKWHRDGRTCGSQQSVRFKRILRCESTQRAITHFKSSQWKIVSDQTEHTMIIYDDVIIFLHFLNDLSQQSKQKPPRWVSWLVPNCPGWQLSPQSVSRLGAAKEPMIAMIALVAIEINSLKEK